MQHETMVMFNMTEAPIKVEHVAWNVVMDGSVGNNETYILYEIVKATYRHPDAKDNMTVVNLEEHNRGKVKATDLNASPYIVMYHAQRNVAIVSRI